MSRPLLVLEATTPIGRALVDQALRQGRAVVAAALDDAGLRELHAAHRRADLTVLPGAANDATSAAALVADLRELGRPLAGVIAAYCCEPRRGRLLDMGDEVLDELVREEMLPHLAAARALVPLLAEGGRNGAYLVIGGPGSEQPWAGYGLRSVAGAANRMLLRVLHDEARAVGARAVAGGGDADPHRRQRRARLRAVAHCAGDRRARARPGRPAAPARAGRGGRALRLQQHAGPARPPCRPRNGRAGQPARARRHLARAQAAARRRDLLRSPFPRRQRQGLMP